MTEQDFILQNLPKTKLPSGKRLKEVLGLSDYTYVWIKKIMNSSIPIYIVTYDSKYPNLFIPMSRVRKQKAFGIDKFMRLGGKEAVLDFVFSYPMRIEEYNKKISPKSIIVRNDLAGEYFAKNIL